MGDVTLNGGTTVADVYITFTHERSEKDRDTTDAQQCADPYPSNPHGSVNDRAGPRPYSEVERHRYIC